MAIHPRDDTESKVVIPIILVDGYTISCEYDHKKLTPKHTTSLADVMLEIDQKIKEEQTPKRFSPLIGREHSRSVTNFVENLIEQHSDERRRTNTMSSELESSLESSQETYILPNNKKKTLNIYEKALKSELSKHSVQQKETTYTEQLEWLEKNFNDYVNTECVSTLFELELLLESLMKCHTCILVTIETNSDKQMNVSYQFLNNFKNEYMVFPVKKDYCVLMKAF